MKLKNILFAFSIILLAVGLVACGGNDNDNDNSNSAAKADNDNGGSDDEEVTLKLAAVESAYGSEVWENIVEDYEASHENVTIDLMVERNLEEVVRPQLQAGDTPDLFLLATDREEALTETMIKDNNVAEISDVLDMEVPGEDVTVEEKMLDGFTETSETRPYDDGELYLAPMFYSPTGLFYNQGLFDEHGWDIPKTWDDMWELGDKAEEEGISLFTYPHSGYFDTLISSMIYSAGGPDLFNEATNYEDGIWESDDIEKVFETIDTLADYTEPNTISNANPNDFVKNQQLVLDNKALFMPNGTWVVDEMEEAPRAYDFEWCMMPVPAFDDDGDRYAFTFFEQIWIPAEAENIEAAKDFIAYMYSDEAADTFLEVGAVQPIEGIVEKLSDEKRTYYDVYEEGDVLPSNGTFAFTDPVPGVNITDELYGKVDSVMSGKISVEDWQKAVEDASDKLRPALK